MTQVIGNLLGNAVKYTPEGGTIELGVEEKDSRLAITVRDNGLGIPPDMLPRIFDVFTQVDPSLARSEGGLGIGVTVVKRLVELHGGTIEAFSEGRGRGSLFVVTLPRYREEDGDRAEEAAPPAAASRSPGSRVLVVDDNVDAAEMLSSILRLFGHEVEVVHAGDGVLDAVRSFRPRVVFLDIGLPGLHGYEVARRVRREFRPEEVLLVAVTGYGREADLKRSEEAGFDRHLVKPVEPELLRRLIEEAEDRSAPA